MSRRFWRPASTSRNGAAEENVGRLQAAEVEVHPAVADRLEELETEKNDGWREQSVQSVPKQPKRRTPAASAAFLRIFSTDRPRSDGRIPPLRTFRRVQCMDISGGGLRFFLP